MAAARAVARVVTTVGRNEVTPKRGSSAATSRMRSGSVVMSTPPAPLHCRSMNPGAMTSPSQSTSPSSRSACRRVDHDLDDELAVHHEVGADERAVEQHLPAAVATPLGLSVA